MGLTHAVEDDPVRSGYGPCFTGRIGVESADFRRIAAGLARCGEGTPTAPPDTRGTPRYSHMTRCSRITSFAHAAARGLAVIAGLGALQAGSAFAATYPVTAEQRDTAQRTAQAGVALSELLPTAPESYTVKTRDTLWGISGLFLKSPWRWPELWGMNLEQIRNPHLIYPGQVLFLDKSNGRARLRMGQPSEDVGAVRLSPRIRSSATGTAEIASIRANPPSPNPLSSEPSARSLSTMR